MVVASAIIFTVLADEVFSCNEWVKNDTGEFCDAHIYCIKVELDKAVTFQQEHKLFSFKSLPQNRGTEKYAFETIVRKVKTASKQL